MTFWKTKKKMNESCRHFTKRLHEHFVQEPRYCPEPGYDVHEHQSMIELTEEDQMLLTRLKERYEMHKNLTTPDPSILSLDSLMERDLK